MQDILSRFNGCWTLRPLRNKGGTKVVGTAATLEQDILPAGTSTCTCSADSGFCKSSLCLAAASANDKRASATYSP